MTYYPDWQARILNFKQMEIHLESMSKRFATHWLFRDISLRISEGSKLGISGPNGSGKSTLLKLLMGAMPISSGKISYAQSGQPVKPETAYRHMAFAAPYTQLIEEYSLEEIYRFHGKFKAFLPGAGKFEDFCHLLEYPFRQSVHVRNYSSGMKQRIKLALAVCSASELLILDEPGSNLDGEGKAWFQALLQKYLGERTTLIASNEEVDYHQCQTVLDVRSLGSRS